MRWHLSHCADDRARPLADRHYNRQKKGAKQFAPPGRKLVLLTEDASALWISSHPYAVYTKHEWAGAWVNSLFRNERPERDLSSELILEAIAATRAHWGDAPPLGIVTFVDRTKVKSSNPGYCYKRAGFRHVGETKVDKLLAFQLLPDEMPPAVPAHGSQLRWDTGAPRDPTVAVPRPVVTERDEPEQFSWEW
jgi:hypothetical protein